MSEQIVLAHLRDIRKQIGLTQDDIARMADITVRTVQRLEAGSPTTVSTAKSISAALMLPSYTELMQSDLEQETLPRKKSSTSSKMNHITVWFGKLKNKLFENRAAIMLIFSALIMLFLTLPVGQLVMSSKTKIPLLIIVICALLPYIVMVVLTYEKEPPSTTQRFSVGGVALLCGLSAVGTIAAAWFSTISYILPLETSSHLMLLDQPTLPSPLDTFTSLHRTPWAVAFIVMAISITLIVFLVSWLRKKGVHFSRFSTACITFGAMMSLSGFALKSLLLKENVWLLFPAIIVLYLLSAAIVFVIEKRAAKDWLLFKVSVFSSVGFLASLFIIFQSLHLVGVVKVMSYREAKVSISSKIEYCMKESKNVTFCWDVRLLEKEQIALTSENLTILMARNGQPLSLAQASSLLQVDKKQLDNQEPFPDAFYQLISDGYWRMTKNATKHGYLYDLIMLSQNEIPNEEGKKVHSHFAFKIGDGLEEFISLINIAKEDKSTFIKSFEKSRTEIKMNAYLRTLYFLASGEAEKYRDRKVHSYSGGAAIYMFEKSDGEQINGKVKLSDIDAIMKIPLSNYPPI